ncbi:MAG: hypothetical protein E7228_03070 [Clostridiales bacterium]|nr:hypothetical protein [Clostridiales bacterium]
MRNRKWMLAVITGLIIALCAGGCGSAGSDPGKEKVEVNMEPIMELSEYPVCDGSATALPLAEALCSALTGAGAEDVIKAVKHNGGNKALESLLASSAELIIVDKKDGEIKAKAEAKGVDVEIIPVARECYVFYTLEDPEADKILTGITKDEADAVVMGQSEIKEIKYDNWYYMSGYLPENVNILAVDGVMPSVETITSMEYPCAFYYNAVIKPDTPADSQARKIIEVLLSDSGQQFIEEAGYVKL